MKLEVGMYVRFKDKRGNTYIRKIIDIPKDNRYASIYIDKEANYTNHLSFKNVLKASNSIIDLIEEKDYIRIVTSAYFEPVYYSYGKLVIRDDIDISKYTNKFVAEVITHEQMGSMSYKLGDKYE